MTESRPAGPAQIAVVIVNYGTADLTVQAVDSVLQQAGPGPSPEIHVVDNASPGDDQAVLSKAKAGWPDTVVLHLEAENHGFGRGNNVVLDELAQRATPPDKVLFLNPDARLVTPVVAQLSAFLDEHPTAGVVGCSILRPETGVPASAAFRFPSMASELSRSANIGVLSRLFRNYQVAIPDISGAQDVDWVSGAAFMARFCALKEAGFFDPAYFLYFEEIDLMQQIRRDGWTIWTCPEARVEHVAGAATGMVGNKRPRRAPRPAYWYDSWRIYFVKNRGLGYARVCACIFLLGSEMNVIYSWLRRKEPSVPRDFRKDICTHVLRPLFSARSVEAAKSGRVA